MRFTRNSLKVKSNVELMTLSSNDKIATETPEWRHGGMTRQSKFDELHWDGLIENIAQGKVVPVIGHELMTAEVGGKCVPFLDAAMMAISRKYGVEFRQDEQPGDFFIRLQNEWDTVRVHSAVKKILKEELPLSSQGVLEKLATIKGFRLFLATTCDQCMENALAKAGDAPATFFFSKNSTDKLDLPSQSFPDSIRTVYHLFGLADKAGHFALMEDERLDYVCRWMDSLRSPKKLQIYLQDKSLLVLGCSFENWLARFSLFGIKGEDLLSKQPNVVVADKNSRNDLQLDKFLSRCKGCIYCEGDATLFVDTLVEKMTEAGLLEEGAIPEKSGEEVPVPPDAQIFISYANEDRAAAIAIKQKLEGCGASVWLDTQRLVKEPGADYNKLIAAGIQRSRLFIPVLSGTTAWDKERRYFRVEWSEAIKEAKFRPRSLPFIIPVAIDDVDAKVDNYIDPDLKDLQWIRAKDGFLSDVDTNQIIKTVLAAKGGSNE